MSSKQPRRLDLTSDLKSVTYQLHIHVHIADMVWAFFDSIGSQYSLQIASEVKSDLIINIPMCILLILYGPF